jgi:ElaB/YqjD/DUF883 family membrane-anchored ribosome-binding protein
MSDSTPPPAPDAGINALRLDADRAREDLEKTLDEIESRLNPQRVIQPVKRAVNSVKTAYENRPVEFIAAAAGVVGTIGGLIALAARSRGSRG